MPWGGHPQGAPLPIAFSRRCALGRAPTRGAPTNCLFSALWPGEGTHKGRPYLLSSPGVMPWGGHPQGAPLPIAFSRRYALGRAPTRGAPTDCLFSALWPGEGAHKGCPYLLSSPGVMPWGGHPQGAPLPIAFSRRCALGRAPTRGAPTNWPSLGVMPWGGHPQGAPLPIAFSRRCALGRAPTRGAPTNCLLSALCPGEGAHKGRPYLLSSLGVMAGGGHPQGVPLPIVFSRRYGPGEGAHKGRPYQLPSLGVMAGGGHPQGAPLPIAFSRRYGLGRAPTRGAATYCLLSGVMPWGGRPQGAPLPDSGSLTWVCPNLMQLPCILGCTRLRWAGRGHSSKVEEAVAQGNRRRL